MKFTPTGLAGAYVIDLERREDHRGFFARTFCRDEFSRHGLAATFPQCNVSFNAHKGTLRGMHYQHDPYPEAKIVSCARGAIYDVLLDLRPASPTFRRWAAFELSVENRRLVYIPEGFAHGFQCLENDTDVYYMMSEVYRPELARGVRWNDAAFGIRWPLADPILSERDATYPDFPR